VNEEDRSGSIYIADDCLVETAALLSVCTSPIILAGPIADLGDGWGTEVDNGEETDPLRDPAPEPEPCE